MKLTLILGGGGGNCTRNAINHLDCFIVINFRFFVVEDTILATTNGLVTRAYINEVWDISLSKVVAVLRTHIVSRGNVILRLAEIISKALIIILYYS